MDSYNKRLDSFKNWPSTAAVKPEELATAGLYYSGVGDVTVCYMCRRILFDWSPGDDPCKEHSKAYPECILSIHTQQAIASSLNSSTDEAEYSSGEDHTWLAKEDAHQEENDEEMKFYDKRLESFKNWSPGHPVKPELLASCGQFYTGDYDETQCYACHRRLQNWTDLDDPYDEHKKNFPECQLSKLPREAVLVQIKSPGNQSDGKILKGPVKIKPDLCEKCKSEKRSIVFGCAHVLFCKKCAKQEKMVCSKCKPHNQNS